jgi:hypothetical protein
MTIFALRIMAASTALLSVALLVGCGGGGSGSTASGASGSSTPPASTSYPIKQAMHAMYANGYQKTYTVTGTATVSGQVFPFSGSLQISQTLVNANATFNGQAAIEDAMSGTGTVTVEAQTVNLGNLIQSNVYQTADNTVLGTTTPNSYCIEQGGSGYPTTAVIGQSGTVSSFACYTDSTKATSLGTQTVAYSVAAGSSATTAIVTLTFTQFNAANQQTYSQQVNYSVDTSANISAQSLVYNINVGGIQVSFTAQ